MPKTLTPSARRRAARHRRILRLAALGLSPGEIAGDSRVCLTERRVRQVLAECAAAERHATR